MTHTIPPCHMCGDPASLYDQDKPVCSRHYTLECACGGPMLAAALADGGQCDACLVEKIEREQLERFERSGDWSE